jgi:primosomal protein N' (replication factor Y)
MTHYYEVIPKLIVGKNASVLTYESDAALAIGQLVEVPVGKKTALGVVVRSVRKPAFTTREISSVFDELILPTHVLDAIFWLSDYYKTPTATVLQSVLPAGIAKKRRAKTSGEARETTTDLPLNQHQKKALADIKKSKSSTVLLHGITGSGKTNIYIQLALDATRRGQSAIILVPEIALTTQLVDNFQRYFPSVVVLHSNQTEAERHINWEKIIKSSEPMVVIGPRSAVFAPVKTPGLIVIDEAHEPSYKQEQSPKYSALRLASFLSKKHGFQTILGTATPLVADYYLADQSGDAVVELSHPAVKNRTAPKVQVVNLTAKPEFSRHRFLSNKLVQSITASLANGKQTLLFHNRRGSANLTICGDCGWQDLCAKCFAPLTLHADIFKMTCHICGVSQSIKTACPDCHNTDIVHKGIGTKLIEEEIRRLFPAAVVARFDADTPKELRLNAQFADVKTGKTQILIGTQVLAKGLDLPNLETVGVIQADANLSIPDFGSEERIFQLLSQVIGRAGRTESASNVIIQTFRPDSEVIRFGIAQDYAGFYEYMLRTRRANSFPPFTYLLILTCAYKTEAAAIRNAKQLAEVIKTKYPDTKLLGPAPSFYERRGDTYRWHVIVKSKRRARLLEIMGENLGPNWQVDIDPVSLL